MQFDTQEQKQLTIIALGELTVKLKEAPPILKIAQSIQEGEVVKPKKKTKLP